MAKIKVVCVEIIRGNSKETTLSNALQVVVRGGGRVGGNPTKFTRKSQVDTKAAIKIRF